MSSSRAGAGSPRPGPLVLLALAALLAPAREAEAAVYLSTDEALALAFPGAQVERRTVYLTREERARARKLAGVDIPSAVVHPYVATRGDTLVGTAYFEVHRVRTASETLMIVVGPGGEVARVEVLAFDEPETYLAPPDWMAQFEGRGLDPDLALKRGIRGIAGATLTARAAAAAVRRTLALHEVVGGGRARERAVSGAEGEGS